MLGWRTRRWYEALICDGPLIILLALWETKWSFLAGVLLGVGLTLTLYSLRI